MRKLAPEEMQNNYSELGPLYKLGQRWDIAMAALYLASDAGLSFFLLLIVFFYSYYPSVILIFEDMKDSFVW